MNTQNNTNSAPIAERHEMLWVTPVTPTNSVTQRSDQRASPLGEKPIVIMSGELIQRRSQVDRGWSVFRIIVALSVAGCFLLGIVVWWRLLS